MGSLCVSSSPEAVGTNRRCKSSCVVFTTPLLLSGKVSSTVYSAVFLRRKWGWGTRTSRRGPNDLRVSSLVSLQKQSDDDDLRRWCEVLTILLTHRFRCVPIITMVHGLVQNMPRPTSIIVMGAESRPMIYRGMGTPESFWGS